VDDEIRAPTEDEVEVRPFAWGVNFKDVFIALGQMKSTQVMAGECAGVVTRVGTNFSSLFKAGDRVAVMIGTPYTSLTRTSGNFVHKIPDSMSYAEASSIPVAFATAYHSIVDCANLQKGDTILIHAASGGVGQAAIMIGQHIGATVFATVGSRIKRQLLMDMYGIPEAYIFSSRTIDFHAGIMRLTGGKGVDVVLNSLSEEALDASWKSVARLGTFVEIGKTDIYRRNTLSMEPFDRNVKFVSVDLAVVAQVRPKLIQDLLKRVFANLKSGHFKPLPIITFPISSIEQAFRLIQARKHTGKVVLEAASNSVVKAIKSPLHLRSDGTYVIVGGLGSLGRQLCRHLQTCGAFHIVLFSRRSFDSDARLNLEKELIGESDCKVKVLTCDITDSSQVFKATEELVAFPPVRGVIQAAMVIAVSNDLMRPTTTKNG
jgi:NADPH:quinone reductase-like Zn-dependent oxidoreductase